MQSHMTGLAATPRDTRQDQSSIDATLNDKVVDEIQRHAPLEAPGQCIIQLSNSLLSRTNRRMEKDSRVDELGLEKNVDRELVSLLMKRGYSATHHMAYYFLAFGLQLSEPDKYHFEYDPQAWVQCPKCSKSYKHSKSFSSHLDICIDLEKLPWHVQIVWDRAVFAQWGL